MQAGDDGFDLLNTLALRVSQFLNVLFLRGNELMQRRIQETDGNRIALQSLIQLLEVALLLGKNLIKSSLSLLLGLGADHLAECVDTIALKEHMLGTAKADSLCAKLTRLLCICRRVGIGAHL